MAELPTTIEIAVADLSQPACIAGIEALTQAIDQGLADLVVNGWFRPAFVTPEGRLDEAEFFAHVRASCSDAVPALVTLIKTFDARAPEVELDLGEPLYGQDEFTDALAGAVEALKDMDFDAMPVIKSRGDRDTDMDLAAEQTMAVEVPIGGLSEPACIAGIEKLARAVEERLPDLVWNDHLCLVFVTPEERVDEAAFFEHVRANCPGAVPALRDLVGTYLARAATIPPILSGHLCGPDAEDGSGVPALGRAVYALVNRDVAALAELRDYLSILDPHHECFTERTVWPSLVRNHGWRDENMIRLAVYTAVRDFFSGSYMWVELGMRDGVRRLTTPRTFAQLMDDEAQGCCKLDEDSSKRAEGEAYAKRQLEAQNYFFREFIRCLDPQDPFDREVREALLAARPRAA